LRGGRGDDDHERGGDRRAAVRFAGFCPHHGMGTSGTNAARRWREMSVVKW
jgi:hypothetical protein